ncbi:MAG: hypothetical protein IJY42_00905 [Clostridia bacterium]|nr:hypothetical protein [Clostridia bacterium]
MTYHNALKYIRNAPSPKDGKPNYNGIRFLCEKLGNPQKRLKYVRLAGTNGKTVCSRMLVSALKEAKISTGFLSLPLHEDIRDNILIDGEPLSMEQLVSLVEQVSHAVNEINRPTPAEEAETDKTSPIVLPFLPTSSELLLTVALLAFREYGCGLCLIESDHNGADPSKFLSAPFSAIICGTIPSGEEREIVKIRSYICRGIQEVISAPQNPEAFRLISDTCSAIGCRLTLPTKGQISVTKLTLRGTDFTYKGTPYSLRMCGQFQVMNAVVVVEALEMLRRRGYAISRQAVLTGLASLTLRSRFEILSAMPYIIADSTHKAVAIETVCDSMTDFRELAGRRVRLCLPEGELIPRYVESLTARGYSIESVITVASNDSAAIESDLPLCRASTPRAAAKQALAHLSSDDILLISGKSGFTDAIRYEILGILGF